MTYDNLLFDVYHPILALKYGNVTMSHLVLIMYIQLHMAYIPFLFNKKRQNLPIGKISRYCLQPCHTM